MRSGFFVFLLSLLGNGAVVAQGNNLDESILFRPVVAENRFEQITPSDIQPKNLYLRWDNRDQKYVWVTGDNRHKILSKSKIQGGRLGMSGQEAKNWYEYTELDAMPWKKNTERSRPEMWRWDPDRVVAGSFTTGIYRSEQAPTSWDTWGGDLDPDVPPVKPPPVDPPPAIDLGCTITASPLTVAVGQSTVLTMNTRGHVISASLDGAAVDYPVVLRTKLLDAATVGTAVPAKLTIRGQVKAPNQGSADCSVEISITAP